MAMSGKRGSPGYSLIELLLAVSVLLVVTGILIQVFFQTLGVLRDRHQLAELDHSLNAVATLLAADIRRGGQGLPLVAVADQTAGAESTTAVLAGTASDTLRLYLDTTADTVTTDPNPPTFQLGQTVRIRTRDSSPLTQGEDIFLWGAAGFSWTWVRARIEERVSSREFGITPLYISSEGGLFTAPPRLTRVDGVSWRRSGDSIMRGELSDPNPLSPAFRELSAGEDFTALEFVFFDAFGAAVDPSVPGIRSGIRRVGFLLEGQTSEALANGQPRRKAITMTVGLRNLAGY